MPKNESPKKFRIGEILVNYGYITEDELDKALEVQKKSPNYIPMGQICVDLKFISGVDLTKVLRKHRKHMYLGELLVNMGIINGEQLEQVLEKQKKEKKRIGELLIELGHLTENQLAKSLSMQLGIPIITPDIRLIDQELAKRFSEAFLRRQEAVPAFEKGGVVTLIMADPLSETIVNDFKKYFDVNIEPAIASRSAIHQLLDTLFNKIEYGLKDIDSLAEKDLIIGNESYAKDSRDDAVKIVNYLISSAITEGASDIHIEPQSYNLRVRYRIDGVLQHKTDLPKQLAPSIVSRIKVMGGMNIAEHRKHQDGRIEARILDNDIDLRVSV
jgi:type IV pilus assembly protein PilB